MSNIKKISQLLMLFIAIYALDVFVLEWPLALFTALATISVSILEMAQSERDIELFEERVKASDTQS